MVLNTIKYDTALKNIANYATIENRKQMEAEAIAITLNLPDHIILGIMEKLKNDKSVS